MTPGNVSRGHSPDDWYCGAGFVLDLRGDYRSVGVYLIHGLV